MWRLYNWFFTKLLYRPGLERHRLVHWWTGTDAFKLMHLPKPSLWMLRILFERLVYRFVEPFVSEHWVNDTLKPYLVKFGIAEDKIRIVENPAWERDYTTSEIKKYAKVKHYRYMVIYYWPKANEKFNYMVYGVNHIDKLIDHFKDCVTFLRLDGSVNMAKVYPVTDAYLRPNLYEGCKPRLVRECELNGIPVYWVVGKQDFDDMKHFVCENCVYKECINEKAISKWNYKTLYLL